MVGEVAKLHRRPTPRWPPRPPPPARREFPPPPRTLTPSGAGAAGDRGWMPPKSEPVRPPRGRPRQASTACARSMRGPGRAPGPRGRRPRAGAIIAPTTPEPAITASTVGPPSSKTGALIVPPRTGSRPRLPAWRPPTNRGRPPDGSAPADRPSWARRSAPRGRRPPAPEAPATAPVHHAAIRAGAASPAPASRAGSDADRGPPSPGCSSPASKAASEASVSKTSASIAAMTRAKVRAARSSQPVGARGNARRIEARGRRLRREGRRQCEERAGRRQRGAGEKGSVPWDRRGRHRRHPRPSGDRPTTRRTGRRRRRGVIPVE